MDTFAISLGTPVPPPIFTGRVHSVFSRAINIEMTHSGEMIGLLSSESADQPCDIRLASNLIPSGWVIRPGQPVMCSQETMQIPQAGFRLHLGSVRQVDCRFSSVDQGTRVDIRVAHDCLQSLLAEKEGIFLGNQRNGPDFHARLTRFTWRLSAACVCQDLPAATSAIDGLIGLGPGLTPSGDDILVGFLAGLSAPCNGRRFSHDFGEALRDHMRLASIKTNAISRKYLCHAARGFFFSDLIQLVTALCREPDGRQVQPLAERVLAKGHSSGFDLLSGTKAALATLTQLV